MALSVFSFEECNPPSDFIQLAYNVSSPNSLDTSTVFNTYSTNGTSLSLGSSLTQPTECGSGMDIVFMVDYTGSMSGAISNVKTGITNILSTIATESLDNFRVGLCIFDEYAGSVTSPSLYGTNTNYTSLPASQKVTINGVGHTQFITCMHPMGGVGDTSVFQTQLTKLAAALPLGDGDGLPEPGGLGVYEVIQNGIAGGFREDAIKVIILITDNIPGGNDDLANATDTAYFANTLIPLADSLNIQTLVQSTKAYNTTYNNYYALATGTTPIGRYDQVSFATSGWINTGLIAGIQSLCGSSYTATCDCAPSGWYHEDGSSYAFYFDATTCEITNQYNFPTPTATPTNTPTPTPTGAVCNEYTQGGFDIGGADYIDCNNMLRYISYNGSSASGYDANIFCAKSIVSYSGVEPQITGLCSDLGNPDPSPTPTNTPTATPSGDGGGGCLITGTQITLADNTLINIEDLLVGTELLSTVFGDMPDTDDVSTLKAWTSASPVISNTTTYLTSITSYIVDKVYNFNNGLIISSYNHLHIVKKNNIWTAAEAYELNIGDVLMSVSGEIVISSIAIINESTTVYKLDVETNDTFIANGIITHNAKPPGDCDPCDPFGECYDSEAFCEPM